MLKRSLDLLVAMMLLIVLMPVMLLTAGLIWMVLGRPVIFTQRRPGKGGVPFTLLKFRTLTNARDSSGGLLPDAERMTPFGKVLRALSLDELPQLINVLKGEMSLVGPRPLLMEYLDRYSPEQARRHEVRPGITGWAQVNGRNATSWAERFRQDVWYVDHCGLLLDLRILVLTVAKVLRRRDVNEHGQATMTPFMGNASPGAKEEE